jgi:hypothetical protein
MDDQRLLQIRERLAKATPGPWERKAGYRTYRVLYRHDGETVREVATCSESIQDMRDADFIAHAPADVADLLTAVDRLTLHLAEVQQEKKYTEADLIESMCKGHGDGQEHTIAQVNAGEVDDMIAPRLQRERGAATQQVEALSAQLKALTKYDCLEYGYQHYYTDHRMEPSEGGDYVRWDDVAALLAAEEPPRQETP